MDPATEQRGIEEAAADALVAEPEAQPQQQTDTEEAQPEQEPEQQGEEQTEEEGDYLPTEQEKVFPDEVLAKYAQRFQRDEKWLADPLNKQLIIDKINSDIYLRSLKEQLETQPEFEEVEEEAEPEPEPIQPAPQLTHEQFLANLNTAVQQRTDPKMADYVYRQFMTAFGVPDDEVNALAPKQAMPFVQALSVGALNLMNTFAQDLIEARFGQFIEQQYPQFGEMYNLSASARTWDAVRSGVESQELPAFGTREFASAARTIGREIAGSDKAFEAMVFANPRSGQPLSAQENLAYKFQLIADKMQQGSREPQIPPALMAQAVKTGEKQAQRKTSQKAAGNLGAGKSNVQTAGGSNDDIFGEGIEIYQSRHGRA